MTDLCRLCGKHKPLEELTCLTDANSTVQFKLESCLKITLDHDKLLPRSSCLTCNHSLDIAFKFAEQVVSVQEKLESDLQKQLDSVQTYESMANKFDIKVERIDLSLHDDPAPSSRTLRKRSLKASNFASKKPPKVMKPVPNPKKESQPTNPKRILKKNIEWEDEQLQIRPQFWKNHKNFGIKPPKASVRYTMNELFEKELNGEFAAVTDEMEIDIDDKLPDGKLSSRAMEQLASIGWHNYSWKCFECAETFPNVLDMERHSLKVHKKRGVINCEPCHKVLANYATYLKHITDRHQRQLRFCCIICSEYRHSFLHLHRHITEAHPDCSVFICLYCGVISFAGALMKAHITEKHIPLPKNFSCDLCPAKFDQKYKVTAHMSYTHLQKNHICDQCGLAYRSQAEVNQHQKSVHSNAYDEKCSFCEKVSLTSSVQSSKKLRICFQLFKNSRRLRRHILEVHEKADLQIACEICGHTSETGSSHLAHVRVSLTKFQNLVTSVINQL